MSVFKFNEGKKFALSIGNDVDEICSPFLSKTKINYYNFVRVLKDKSRITLSNNSRKNTVAQWATFDNLWKTQLFQFC